MRNRSVLAVLGLAAAAVMVAAPLPAAAATGATDAAGGLGAVARGDCPQLSKKLEWYGHNRAKLQRMIDERGLCGHAERGGHSRPVAAFDWDNTVVKNDTTDITLAWALKHDKILRPKSWSDTSKWLTPEADRALTKACGTAVPVGRPLPTSKDTDCTDEIFEIRAEAQTMSGAPAFAGDWNHRRTVPEYAWVAQLFAGHTPEQVGEYAEKGRVQSLAAPVGSKMKVGTHSVPAYVRYYPQQRDLIRTLQRAGFDVYIVSAGVEYAAEVWARGVGIDAEHTIAIRSVLKKGRITTFNEGCGGEPASQGETIPYIDGKRCWINQDIYGIKGPDAWERQDAKHRIALGGGDANTDVTFVGDATGSHLILNRNQDEVMCRAYDNADGRWVINPMFIEPLPRRTTAYPCATSGYINEDGSLSAVRRLDGSIVPDQQDRVFG
ncbi:haloacid dehalogenase-like hydrolase [Streptomyces albidus (ex Kaewkla and Franco 2022)]|uniref:haloacid dehalogenase-like hydrolase n=1 Tax=Streptomyces albidus (ex Kaewkla and Franco 2022) TaxID=722709 RepID=UPI0015EF13CF|nr:haloacid dehalogenase-like hydrolase [Streptomyces albidus (ex Kaewkla and Franco 2022)]